VQEISAAKGTQLNYIVLQAFAAAAPEEGVALLPHLAPSQQGEMIGALARGNHVDLALKLYRESLSRGELQSQTAYALISQTLKQDPAEARKLFQEMLSAGHFEGMEPFEAYRMLDSAKLIARVDPALAANACGRVAALAAPPDYGAHASTSISGSFQI